MNRTTIRLPSDLLKEMKIQAIRAGRSFNTHVAVILQEAAGAKFGDHAPAAPKAQVKNHKGENAYDSE